MAVFHHFPRVAMPHMYINSHIDICYKIKTASSGQLFNLKWGGSKLLPLSAAPPTRFRVSTVTVLQALCQVMPKSFSHIANFISKSMKSITAYVKIYEIVDYPEIQLWQGGQWIRYQSKSHQRYSINYSTSTKKPVQQCLRVNQVPDHFKGDILISIPKKGPPPEYLDDHRGFTVFACTGKVFEHIIIKQTASMQTSTQSSIWIHWRTYSRSSYHSVNGISLRSHWIGNTSLCVTNWC